MAAFGIPNYGNLSASSLDFGNSGLAMPALGNGLGTELSSLNTGVSALGNNATQGFNFGMNIPTFQLGMNGLNTLGNLWGAWQANSLARDQLDFTKGITNTNLNNQIKSYNTALSDRARARGFTEGQSQDQINSYVADNRLSR